MWILTLNNNKPTGFIGKKGISDKKMCSTKRRANNENLYHIQREKFNSRETKFDLSNTNKPYNAWKKKPRSRKNVWRFSPSTKNRKSRPKTPASSKLCVLAIRKKNHIFIIMFLRCFQRLTYLSHFLTLHFMK